MFTKVKLFIFKNPVDILFYSFLGSVLLGILLIYVRYLNNASDIIKYYGFAFSILAILSATLQFRANHEWNRRQFAIKKAWQIRSKLDDALETLNKHFDFARRGTKEIISVDLIHSKICKDKNNSKEVLCINYEGEGHKVFMAIRTVLNSFEFLAAGINQGVFDEKVLRTLFEGSIIKAYFSFKDYITHVNNDMHPDRQGRIWMNFKKLAEKYDEESTARTEEREKTG